MLGAVIRLFRGQAKAQAVSLFYLSSDVYVATEYGADGSEPCYFVGPVLKVSISSGPLAIGKAVSDGLAACRYDFPFVGLYLLAFGAAGFLNHRIDLSGRRRMSVVLEGGPAWLMALAAILGAAVLLSVWVDHYDRRDNERHYRAFRWVATRLGWCALVSSLIAYLYLGFTK